MAQRALAGEATRKRQIAIMRGPDNYVTLEKIPHIDVDGLAVFEATDTVFKACADVSLVLAVTRHRNPDATVFFFDEDNDVLRIH